MKLWFEGEKMTTDEGQIKDLVEKLEKGEITVKEVKRELKERDLQHHRAGGKQIILGFSIVLGLLFIYLPVFANLSQFEFLSFFTQLTKFHFPIAIPLLLSAVLIFGVFMTGYASHLLRSKGGLKEGDETIRFLRKGPYKVMRHPIAFGMFCLLILPPIIFSDVISYTILAFIGQLVLIFGMFLGPAEEDKMNVRKWGDEYRQYMKEVPRFNFIKGLWNLRKRK